MSSLVRLLLIHHLYGIIFSKRGVSAVDTNVVPLRFRRRFVVLLVRICCLNALARETLPLPVLLNRFAAPR